MLILASALKNPGQVSVPDAAVWVQGNTIRFAGARSDLPAEATKEIERIEAPGTLLIPGLVNAHAHLELTALKSLPYPGGFTAWIRAVLAAKNHLNDFTSSDSMEEGIRLSLESGVTTIADHVSVTGDLETLLQSPLRGFAFVEIIGVVPEIARDVYRTAKLLREKCLASPTRFRVIPSPHSVHALDPQVLENVLMDSQELCSLHLGESADEEKYFREKSGPLHDLIAERGASLWRAGKSAIHELERLGLLNDRILAVHGNYLDAEERKWLRERAISIVHCPLSHRYFSHRPFPLQEILDAGINVALGTDSLASSASLSMFDVMRTADTRFAGVNQEAIFSMATLGGAKALKMDRQIGSIEPGKLADIVGLRLAPSGGALDSVFQTEKVDLSIIDGKTTALD